MDAVDQTIPLLGAHLKSLDAQQLLQWQGIIMKHATYSAKSNAMVTSEADFAQFAGAVMENPLSKVQVKISMNDPGRTAREQQQERAQQDTLAMSYGPEDTRLALERAQARLALNPRADVNAARRLSILADLTRHLIAKYGGNAESRASRIRRTRTGRSEWAAIVYTPGVGPFCTTPLGSILTTPPGVPNSSSRTCGFPPLPTSPPNKLPASAATDMTKQQVGLQ
ncbi:hypothetical protein PTTG_26175 [Puccinia triticina 1-1 BBBD Race 1]|uniref:Uncharacterized protein n=1 Tax=Puccinia triticina (isolate 1-1 / race 1 (BBBD)) TaxID=630390 RepID=A0A180GWZ8_PUCT1|nr:hypothetical protein PTTG_26175 [Puccinia triticina 1-1 BBBD Race 1]